MTEYLLESWRKALEESGMIVDRPKHNGWNVDSNK